jgi:hypothetical protein
MNKLSKIKRINKLESLLSIEVENKDQLDNFDADNIISLLELNL